MFQKGKCSKCLKTNELMYSNNPIIAPICFHCIEEEMDAGNLNHADFFCRSYNLPFEPLIWIQLQEKIGQGTFRAYALDFYNKDKENLYYQTSTADLWKITNSK